jgi:hypothetical protein
MGCDLQNFLKNPTKEVIDLTIPKLEISIAVFENQPILIVNVFDGVPLR